MAERKKIHYRMGPTEIISLIIISGFADVLTLIPFIGIVVGPIFWIIFSLYLFSRGFGLINSRRLVTSVVSIIAELIPAVQAFPTIVGGVIIVIILIRVEDKLGVKLTGKNMGANIKNIRDNAGQIRITGRAVANLKNRRIEERNPNINKLNQENRGRGITSSVQNSSKVSSSSRGMQEPPSLPPPLPSVNQSPQRQSSSTTSPNRNISSSSSSSSSSRRPNPNSSAENIPASTE